MSEALTVRVNGAINATLVNTQALDSVVDTFNQSISVSLNPGNGASGLADQVFSDQRQLAANAGEVINVYNFNGSNDKVGGALTMTKVKALAIAVPVQSTWGTAAITVTGGGAGANGWTSAITGTNTVVEGGMWLETNPGSTGYSGVNGYTVGASSNNLLKITNSTANIVQYTIFVAGATA